MFNNNQYKTINPYSLIIAQLFTVKEKYGYIKRKQLNTLINERPSLLNIEAFEEPQDIIIYGTKMRNFFNLTPAKEYLTGVHFPFVMLDTKPNINNRFKAVTAKRELDSFVYIPRVINPNIKEIEEYTERHKDIKSYREELIRIRENSKFIHEMQKECELDDFFFGEMK